MSIPTFDASRRVEFDGIIEKSHKQFADEEIEIRIAAIYTTALLTESINKRRPEDKAIIIPQLDYRLWKNYHATHYPHHLTYTTMY